MVSASAGMLPTCLLYTSGAGDTFFGAALSKLCKEELDTLTVDKPVSYTHLDVYKRQGRRDRFGNHAAAPCAGNIS